MVDAQSAVSAAKNAANSTGFPAWIIAEKDDLHVTQDRQRAMRNRIIETIQPAVNDTTYSNRGKK